MRLASVVAPCAAVFSVGAFAQSNVAVYGLIDMSINHVRAEKNAKRSAAHLTAMGSDASRLGFRGTEDLGGGNRAYFKLETGISADTGAPTNATQFWNRESYVGLGSESLGSVQVGSQYTPWIWTTGKIDPFGRFGIGTMVNLLQGSPRGWSVTFNNSAQYITPNLGGVVGRVMASAPEGSITGASYGAALEITRGKLYVALNYDQTGATLASVGLPGSGRAVTRTFGAGLTYDLDLVKLAGWYQSNRGSQLPTAEGYMLGATVPVGASEIRGSFVQRRLANADAKQFAVGQYYFLSKRTTVFWQIARLKNSGTGAAFGLGPTRIEQASLLAGGNRTILGTQIGMRHVF
ncbi:porin [Variovorax paradoxus]|uniref:porin n=1 Tax=Variovorax paradoxus TaxID=34073 RepID=UPI003ED04556